MTKDEALNCVLFAVEQSVRNGSCYWEIEDAFSDYESISKEALAEPAQEPTCWITAHGEGFRIRFEKPDNGVPLGWMELYTHPAPAKEWVELSDDEIKELSRNNKCWMNAGGNLMFDWDYFARAIEKALKEKNYATNI